MTKFCPFMSTNPAVLSKSIADDKFIPCMDSCALYWKGFCSINVLAQKATADIKKETKNSSK
ncbi:hypothetical protein [Roseburia inulinivorans]|uniref:hypothetical protein n=1 Tax=Roseburia inulinivorans TaxID=360807 RepID=UPI003FEEB646